MNTPPEWAFEFHGHRCPFMPIGYRMGKLAMKRLGVEREKDHGFYVVAELGEGHPQTCMMDGIQAATGATYGKLLLSRTFWGKLAAVFAHPEKGAVRYALNADFMDEMGKHEFFSYRKRGVEPSEIPAEITDDLVKWIAGLPDETVFKVEDMVQAIGLESAPVAVFLLAPDADMAPFAGWQAVERHRYCQALMKARAGGRVILEADELACPAARAFI